MRKITLYIPLVLALLALASCQKTIEFDGEVKEPKIVVNALFNTEDTFMVGLSNSLSVIDAGNLKELKTATVKIFDENDAFLGNALHSNNGFYKAVDLKLAENKTYKIEVSNEGYKTVFAEDKIPAKLDNISFDTSSVQIQNGWREKQVNIKFNDPTESNYYMIELRTVYKNEFGGPKEEYIQKEYIGTNDPNIINKTGNGTYYSDRLIFGDKNYNGKNYTFSFTCSDYIFNDPNYVRIEVLFSTLSRSAYNYFSSVDRYVSNSGNPFATPVQVYSNIENGFGIFGGAAIQIVELK